MWMDSVTISSTRLDFIKWLAIVACVAEPFDRPFLRQLETRPVWDAGVAGILITDPRFAQRYRLPQGAV